MLEPMPAPINYFDARERRLVVALRVSEVLNSLVRPCLALMFGATIIYMAIIGQITSGELLGIGAGILGFFFQSRQTEKVQERLDAQQREAIDLARAVPPESQRP